MPDHPVEPAELIDDFAARRENVRRWWRRAIVMALFLGLTVPSSVAIFWRARQSYLRRTGRLVDLSNAPGPRDPALIDAYQNYLMHEGPTNHGFYFLMLTRQLDPRARMVGEDEIRFYLGAPQRIVRLGGDETYIYECDFGRNPVRSMSIAFLIVTQNGRRVVGAVTDLDGAANSQSIPAQSAPR